MKLNNIEETEELFRDKLKSPRDFLQLLQVLDQIPGDWWTTWVSSHPNYMTDELIAYIGKSSSWSRNEKAIGHQRPYLHFALQSGSDSQLKKMNRRYSFEEFSNVVKKMYKEIPNVSLSTDIIVGFINESMEDFQKTLDAERECRFDMMFISEYSPRPGTASARLKDNVDKFEKARRKEELNDLLREIARENNQKLIGTKQKVLVVEMDKKLNCLNGRTAHNKEIKIKNSTDLYLIGKFVEVEVTSAGPWSLESIIRFA
jgi:tRNA-2-methylthio-N6-dimethylallyladenosine synthase